MGLPERLRRVCRMVITSKVINTAVVNTVIKIKLLSQDRIDAKFQRMLGLDLKAGLFSNSNHTAVPLATGYCDILTMHGNNTPYAPPCSGLYETADEGTMPRTGGPAENDVVLLA
jgi:beta-glucosidase-like glycosyl hydrolase